MRTELYLDTARFGRMRPGARAALDAYARLCTVEGGSLRLLDILRGDSCREFVPGWTGLEGLRASARRLANAPAGSRVHFAQRSAPLARLVARAMFGTCRSVLCTDLEWPRYRAFLEAEARRSGGELVCLPVLHAVFRGDVGRDELVRRILAAYRARRCDGLFLSDVTSHGVRLPASAVLKELGDPSGPRFVAVDGAQAVGHVPCDLETTSCDAYLAGCHKWLGAGQTLAFLVCPRGRSRGTVEAALPGMINAWELDDPLLLLLRELEGTDSPGIGDTADLACLFSGSAALSEVNLAVARRRFMSCGRNARRIEPLGADAGWRPLPIDPRLGTGIRLVQADTPAIRSLSGEHIRRLFQSLGVALSAYADGILRLSMHCTPLESGSLATLVDALSKVSVGGLNRAEPEQTRLKSGMVGGVRPYSGQMEPTWRAR